MPAAVGREREVRIRLSAKDGTSAAVGKVRAGLTSIGSTSTRVTANMKQQWASTRSNILLAVAGITAALYAVRRAVGAVIESGMEQEAVWAQVTASLERHGEAVALVLPQVQQFADTMQTFTGISDEVVATAFQRLLDSNLSLQDSFALTRGAMDLATAKGMDIAVAADLIGKSIDSTTNALSRYGIALDKTAPRQVQIARLQREINTRFGGAAAARMDAMQGHTGLFSEKLDDLYKALFDLSKPGLMDGMSSAADLLDRIANAVERLGGEEETHLPFKVEPQIKEMGGGLARLADWLFDYFLPASPKYVDPKNIASTDAAFQAMSRSVQGLVDAVDPERVELLRTIGEGRQLPGVAPPAITPEGSEFDFGAQLQAEFDAEVAHHNRRAEAIIAVEQRIRDVREQMRREEIEAAQAEWEMKVAVARTAAGSMASLMQGLSALTGKHQKAAFTAYKAFAIAQAIIDAHRAVNIALATLPPPWSYAQAAASFAMAMGRVAQISAMQPTGTISGSAPAAPTSGQQQGAQEPTGTSGPQYVTIHLHGTVIDRAALDDFARSIAEPLRVALEDGA